MGPIIDVETLWLAQTNCYVIAPNAGSEAIVVDAPPEPALVGEMLRRRDLVPVALLVTHGHIDHVGGAGALARSLQVSAYLHPDDDWLATDPETQLQSLFGMVPDGDFAPPDRFETLADGQVLTLAGIEVEVLHTPGHTPGHCCFHLPDEGIVFSGDQLFAGSIGRTDLPGGSFVELMRSMKFKLLPLDPGTSVLPGHGPTTTLARELQTNPFLQELR